MLVTSKVSLGDLTVVECDEHSQLFFLLYRAGGYSPSSYGAMKSKLISFFDDFFKDNRTKKVMSTDHDEFITVPHDDVEAAVKLQKFNYHIVDIKWILLWGKEIGLGP